MSRLIATAICLLLGTATAFAQPPANRRFVNLNTPGAMEKLQVSDPRHYEKVIKILDGLEEHRNAHVARWLEVSFEAKDVAYSDILLTTYPPQKDLSFRLDDATYSGRITLERPRARFKPIRSR